MKTFVHAFCRVLLGIMLLVGFLQPLREVAAAECAAEQVRLQVLGSGGPELNDGRASSGYLLWHGERALLLVDAGAGTARGFEAAGARFDDLEAVLLTHLHVDHSADLPALIKGGYFTPRQRPLVVYGPDRNARMPATSEFIAALFGPGGAYPYLADHLREDSESFTLASVDVPLLPRNVHRYQLSAAVELVAVPVHHGPIAAVAWRVNVGQCSLSFSGDMSGRYGTLASLAKGSDVLVAHHAIPEHTVGVARQLHMPPSEIARIARDADVGQLLLSHHMLRSIERKAEALRVIRPIYKGEVVVAEDMQLIEP